MSNAMYYAARFGQPSVLLKDRLGMVPSRKVPATSLTDAEAMQQAERADE